MKLMPIPFGIFSICGFWRPPSWSSSLAVHMYSIFSVFMYTAILTFTLSQMMDVILTVNNLDDFAGNSFMMLSMMNVCFKMTCVLRYRKPILNLFDSLTKKPFKPTDKYEMDVIQQRIGIARKITLCNGTLTLATVVSLTIKSFFGAAKGILAFRAWIPYNYEKPLIFWFTFMHQTIAHIAGASIQVANESWMAGMMMQTIAQIKIVSHRFKKAAEIKNNVLTKDLKTKTNSVESCIKYHNSVINFAEELNRIIKMVVMMQFTMSSMIISLSVYLLSTLPLISAPFFSLTLYFIAMCIQIFIYCWYGNEIIIESSGISNILTKMEWLNLESRNQKLLLLVMKRCCKPMKISSYFLVTLSVNSFTKIMKMAYSIFNVFTQSI